MAGWGSVSGVGHNPAMKLRRLRDGDVLEDGDVVLVRGDDLDSGILSGDAVALPQHLRDLGVRRPRRHYR